MKRSVAILVLCFPLAAAGAEWHYDGRMAASQAAEPAASAGGTVTAAANIGRNVPVNSMSMSVVRETFGEPEQVLGPVGEPPITRWQYPQYVVYFENDLVITTVGGHL